MLFKVSDDWKQLLPPEDEARLNELLKRVSKYRSAYKSAQDVKTAQLWAALLEVSRENRMLLEKLKKVESFFDHLKEGVKRQDESQQELVESLEKF